MRFRDNREPKVKKEEMTPVPNRAAWRRALKPERPFNLRRATANNPYLRPWHTA